MLQRFKSFALAMGNTVVIKSSELAPATLFEFGKLEKPEYLKVW